MDIDLHERAARARIATGKPVYLRDIWPTNEEVQSTVRASVDRGDVPDTSTRRPSTATRNWKTHAGADRRASTSGTSTPPTSRSRRTSTTWWIPTTSIQDLHGMRVLAMLGDSVTTDHISPAGSIPKDSPAGKYLIAQGVEPEDFNSYGARRGNHEVMVRGTLANIRLRNQLAPGTEGGWTVHLPDGEQMFIYDASMKYQSEGVPLLILAGKEYGSGSSRDWAAKGVLLLGVKAVIAESFERIHRTNLVGMGVLPLQFLTGESVASLKLTGKEIYHIEGVSEGLNRRRPARRCARFG